MDVERVIREVTVRGSVQGVDEVGRAFERIASASDKASASTERQNKVQIDVQQMLEKSRRQYQDNYREQTRYTDAIETQRRTTEQMKAAQAVANAEMQTTRARLEDVTAAQRDMAVAANDNMKTVRQSGIEFSTAAGHMLTASKAAYSLSPAFRGMVHASVMPALNAMGAAIGAAGLALNATGTRAIAASTALAAISPRLAPVAAALKTTGTALEAFSPTIGYAASAISSRLGPALMGVARFAGPVLLVVDTIRAMINVAELGAQKIKELTELSANAGAAGVGTNFFQRQMEGAKALKLEVEQAMAAMKKFKEVSDPTLGGSAFDRKLADHQKAGNFGDNSGVEAYRQAATVEEKYRAAGQIITIAIEKGERLAGLDLAATFLPPEMLERLKANGDLLRELQQAAENIKPAKLVSAEEIGYANELKRRLADAEKIIGERLLPLQKDLTAAGLNFQSVWVRIHEVMAASVSMIASIYDALKKIPEAFASMGNLPIWGMMTKFTGTAGINATPESAGIVMRDNPAFTANATPGSVAQIELKSWLQDTIAVQTQMKNLYDITGKVRQDLSRPLGQNTVATAATQTRDAYDRAMDSLTRKIELDYASATSVGRGATALQRAREQAAKQKPSNDNRTLQEAAS